jgi:hypothetical protein
MRPLLGLLGTWPRWHLWVCCPGALARIHIIKRDGREGGIRFRNSCNGRPRVEICHFAIKSGGVERRGWLLPDTRNAVLLRSRPNVGRHVTNVLPAGPPATRAERTRPVRMQSGLSQRRPLAQRGETRTRTGHVVMVKNRFFYMMLRPDRRQQFCKMSPRVAAGA